MNLLVSAGQLLATYEDNTREFLFPTPRASPSYPGVDREVLLRRSSTFPGIAPKLEFSSRTVIKEVQKVEDWMAEMVALKGKMHTLFTIVC